jgi:hypothetical protein
MPYYLPPGMQSAQGALQSAQQYQAATPEGRTAIRGKGSLASRAVNWAGQRNAPQIGANPYLGQWNTLLGQLGQQANGQGPSLASQAFSQASAAGLRQQQSLAAGGSAGAARQAGMNMARINQGQAAGFANARLQEQMAARQALVQALQGAGNAWFQPQAANLQATMGTPTNGQMLLGTLGQVAGIGGMLFGGPGGAAGAQAAKNWIGPPGGSGNSYTGVY